MFLLAALMFVILGHLTTIAAAIIGLSLAWGVVLIATRPTTEPAPARTYRLDADPDRSKDQYTLTP
jgi:hypothetical protein